MTKYRIETDQKLIIMQLSGEVSVSGLENFVREVSIDENFDPSFDSIVDIRRLETVYSTFASHEVLDSVSYIIGGVSTRSAIIADSYLRVKMIDITNLLGTRKHIELKGFSTVKDACSWLAIDVAGLELNAIFA